MEIKKPEIIDDYVVKSNLLINVMANLSLQENRFLAYIISLLDRRIQPGKDPIELEVVVRSFAEKFEIETKNIYNLVEELADTLQQKILKLDPKDCLDNRRRKIGVIIEHSYLDQEGRAFITLSPHIIPHLLGLKERFTTYRIKDVYQFSSKHSWNLYELLLQYKNLKRRKFDVEELRRKTVGYNVYTRWADFKRRVVDSAVSEINKKSDIETQYSIYKTGKRVTQIEFFIREKTQSQFETDLTKQTNNDNTQKPKKKYVQKHMFPEEVRKELDKILDEYKLWHNMREVIINEVIEGGWDYKTKVIDKLPMLRKKYNEMPEEKRTTDISGFIYGCLKKELKIETVNKKKIKDHELFNLDHRVRQTYIYEASKQMDIKNKYNFESNTDMLNAIDEEHHSFDIKLWQKIYAKAISLYEQDKRIP